MIIFGKGYLNFWHIKELKKMLKIEDFVKKLKANKAVQLFNVPIKKVKVVYPWYYFGGGCFILVDNIKFKISFMKPANTEFNVKNPEFPISSGMNIISNNVSNLNKGMDIAGLWKEVFLKNNVISKK